MLKESPMRIPLDLVGSILNFIGGAFLTWDALTVRKKIKGESGIRDLQEALEKKGAGDLLTHDGHPLGNEQTFQVWLSLPSLVRTKIGFLLITVGFLLDLITKCDQAF
jgi:hypothetical protein